jgi:molybdopterin converting factor small subunit
MAVEVRIPTILRTYTGGEKAVTGSGATLSELIDDLESNHPGIKDRLVEAKDGSLDLRRFVNVYVNDEDVRFTGGLATEVGDGDQVVVLPAVAGGCPAVDAFATVD